MATWPMVQVSYMHTLVRSLCNLHSLGPLDLGCVNSVETCTSVYNLHISAPDGKASAGDLSYARQFINKQVA